MMFRDDTLPISSGLSTSELFPDSTPSHNPRNENNLDDIWGSASSSPTSDTSRSQSVGVRREPSDVPRLRSEHSTAGYRDGLSSAKNTTIQEGFDEGYSLGAVMGLEVGILLGSLEGILHAEQSTGFDESEMKRRYTLLNTARRELGTAEVFGRDWWSEDGTWKFEVLREGGDGAGEYMFKDVVSSHPMIQKWSELVKKEIERWGLDLGVMERAEGHGDGGNDEE